jgi:hypothetical protein
MFHDLYKQVPSKYMTETIPLVVVGGPAFLPATSMVFHTVTSQRFSVKWLWLWQ